MNNVTDPLGCQEQGLPSIEHISSGRFLDPGANGFLLNHALEAPCALALGLLQSFPLAAFFRNDNITILL